MSAPADADGDFLSDMQETRPSRRDSDGDGSPDYLDLDSDGDGLPDADEAGDEDLSTPPRDTDGDGIPDFRDRDSDDDGLSDGAEATAGTNPYAADSDEDGVSDLVESVVGSDALDPDDHPAARGVFVFESPYRELPSPASDSLRFRTSIQLADVYFLFDRTTSMRAEIETMRDAVVEVIDSLTCAETNVPCDDDLSCGEGQICDAAGRCGEDPVESGCLRSVFTGAGYYGGSDSTTPLGNVVAVQGDPAVTVDRVAERIPIPLISYGGDETLFQAAQCFADPTACSPFRFSRVDACATVGVGCPGFRTDAIRILVQITDESNELADDRYRAETAGRALAEAGVVFVGVDAGAVDGALGEGASDLRALAAASESFGAEGEPLVFAGDEDAVDEAVVSAVLEVARARPLGVVDIEVLDEPGDSGDARLLIERVIADPVSSGCGRGAGLDDKSGDGELDAYLEVPPGTPLCWTVTPAANTVAPASRITQVFRARLVVRGDGSPLDERPVVFLVPPEIPQGPF